MLQELGYLKEVWFTVVEVVRNIFAIQDEVCLCHFRHHHPRLSAERSRQAR